MLPITGYADRWSAKPGETIRFMVSVEGGADYTARIARIHCGDPNPAGPGYREQPMPSAVDGRHAGQDQPIRRGSRVDVPAVALEAGGRPLGLVATVWPTLAGTPGVVLAWQGNGVEVALGVGPQGAFCRVGGEVLATGVPLTERCWHDIALVLDPVAGTTTLVQQPRRARLDLVESATATRPLGAVPAGMGAASIAADRAAAGHFNGKIERPRSPGGSARRRCSRPRRAVRRCRRAAPWRTGTSRSAPPATGWSIPARAGGMAAASTCRPGP
ncbi:hypothetical protein ACFQY5_33005 [Paeniroseomonas aquatica]|uniref:hypothetical protein n=1 Tax=Paeniroseomonas aquatica TaxID=373043 RepID=UPI00362177DB